MATTQANWRVLAMALAIVALSAFNARAITIVPANDGNDGWIFADAGGGGFWVADGLSTFAIGAHGGSGPNGRYGVARFDLSSIAFGPPVTDVRLRLASAVQRVDPTTLVAAYVDSSIGGTYTVGFDGAYYTANLAPVEHSFETLGSATFQAGVPLNDTYTDVGVASAADIAVFNAARQLPNPSIMIFYKATAGARDWGDTVYHALPPQLIVDLATPPALGDIDGDTDIDLVDYGIMTDPSHWLKSVTPNTNGDLNGSGFVDLLDFALFKPAYLEYQGGGGGELPASGGVPEPSTLALLAAALPAWLLFRRKRGPRCP